MSNKKSASASFKRVTDNHFLAKLLCAFLIINLLTISTPAAPRTIAASLGEFHQDLRFSFLSGNLAANIGGWASNLLLFLPTVKKRTQQVGRIEILPGEATVSQGEELDFSAVAYTNEGDTVGGLRFEWTVEFLDRTVRLHPMRNGRFKSKIPGTYRVTATTADGLNAQTTVTVREDAALVQLKKLKDDERRGDFTEINRLKKSRNYTTTDISSKQIYESPESAGLENTDAGWSWNNLFGWFGDAEKAHGPNAGNAENPEYKNTSSAATKTAATLPLRPADEDGWNNNNWATADDPANQIGNPPGTAPDAGAGNGNFQFSAPVVALPGRGINLNLSLNYNSRLWSKSGSQMSYDSDKGFPAPGWSIGFGKLMFMGTSGGCMLAGADGTRHGYTGSVSNYNYSGGSSTNFTGYATDGTLINYSCNYSSSTSGKSLSGSAQLADGTVITYNSPTITADQAYPTRITDPQGNYITITYRSNRGPDIQTITDTLGRVVTFNYDSLSRLISVDVPQYNGGTRTAVRLHYKQLTLAPGFSGLTTDTANSTPYVIDAIYYPGTNTGFWFGADSNASDYSTYYSSYGMIAKVVGQRGMSWSGSAGNQGTVVAGTMTKQAVYNYPLTADNSLTDAPTYTTLTETWAGMDTAAAVTNYNIVSDSATETITVTYPNGTKSKQISYNNAGAWNDGLFYQNEILDTSNNQLGKTLIYMAQGSYNSFRPTRIDTTDERNQMTYTTFTYGTNYNQPTSQKEYNYAGTLFRDTRSTYENGTNYTNRHIFNLVKTTEVFDANNNRLSKTAYEYDNAPLMDTPDVVMYDRDYDPNTPGFCYECGECLFWTPPEYPWSGDVSDCHIFQGEEIPNGDAIYKGNVTKVMTYSDATNLTGAVSYDYTYDITGNQRTATTNCCQQMTFNYTTNTQYSQPESHTKGSSDVNSPDRMTQSATFDFNTSAMKTATDFNGRTTAVSYDAATERPTLVTLPTGSKKTIEYADATLSATETVQNSDNSIVGKATVFYNGRGQTQISKYQAGASNWNAVEMKYDQMGRQWKTSLPYDAGSSPSQWTEYFYDNLSRATQVTAPDGSTQKTFYNETTRPGSASTAAGQTMRSQDAWGRERWARTDDFGRLAEVVEPNPAGNGGVNETGSLQTSYLYDTLDQLTQITQGDQTRAFKYDSLGRMTRQKLAEQTATINDAGIYVGAGGTGATWSDTFSYDVRSNITQRTDARGVKTNFSYLISSNPDPLNRLQSISFDTSSADTTYTINAAPNVAMEYMTAGDKTRIKKVISNNVSTEEYAYDTEGRVADYTMTLSSRTSYPMQTSYLYDTTNRLTEVRYPAAYGLAGNPRKVVNVAYDEASRLKELKVGGAVQMNEIAYNTFSQTTSVKVGAATSNPLTETYNFDSLTGLMTNQKVKRTNSGQTLLDLSYEYNRGLSKGSLNGKTGSLTKIVNNLDRNKDRIYEHDVLGRLIKAKGGLAAGATGVTANWTQDYSYDRYGNKLTTASSGVTANSAAIPTDGLPSLGYTTSSNRISTSGYDYDKTGNLIRGQSPNGTWQRFEYDAAGRLVKIKDDSNNVLETYTYDASRQRLIKESNSQRTYYAWGGANVLVEYFETASTPTWTKSYIYAGSRLLSTITNTLGTEATEYHHPDRLGTKLVSNSVSHFEQSTLPFGTYVAAESTGATNQTFTSYDRNTSTGLDYAVNRTYNSGQSRFTQVDPIGMAATSIGNPQSMNLFAYVENKPVDFIDPSGLNRTSPGTTYSSGILWTVWYGNNEDGWRGIFSWFEPYGSGNSGDGLGSGDGNDNSQTGISKDCIQLLKDFGVWDKVQKLLKNPPLFDVDLIEASNSGFGSDGLFGKIQTFGSDYFGESARAGETLGESFDRLVSSQGGALTNNTNITGVLYRFPGTQGIYFRSSQSNILSNPNFLLHEIVHLVIPETFTGKSNFYDPDEILVREFQLKTKKGETFSRTVSRFFNGGCKTEDRNL